MIDGVSIGGYRSFGGVQRICPLTKVNVFAGANNSGKSNVLRFIHAHLRGLIGDDANAKPRQNLCREVDLHIGQVQHPMVAGIGTNTDSERIVALRKECATDRVRQLLDQIIEQPEISCNTRLIWRKRASADFAGSFNLRAGDENTAKQLLRRIDPETRLLDALLEATRANWRGGSVDGRMHHIVKHLLGAHASIADCVLIPAVRQVTSTKQETKRWCGAGIVDHLAQLQNPSHHQQEKKALFRGIESLLRDVTGNLDASLEIPYGRDSITVHMDNKPLPLASLGTGIHQLIILAAACTTLESQIVCVEELELHMHPVLQRKLLKYITENTNNQYFITSHSAAVMDPEFATVFRITHDGLETQVQLASKAGDRWQVCRELGYKASDLVQSNCVVWVEGPSDRIYMNHWLKSTAPELKEGTHYSIMFYGGRLLSHLSADDEEIDDFISLNHLNRNPAIVIDRDRDDVSASINETKQRIRTEFENVSGICWVTAGRQIENYIPEDLQKSSLASVKSGSSAGVSFGQFDKTVPHKFDKVKLARKVVESDSILSPFDLQARIDELIEYIRRANE